MLTNNWRAFITNRIFSVSSSLKPINGTAIDINTLNFLLQYHRKICIGTGTTPASATDYNLENEIDSEKYHTNLDISCATGSGSYEKLSGINLSGTITNVSENPLEVTEIGMFGSQSNNPTNSNTFLFAREVFDTPITISPGGGTGFQLKTLLTSLLQRGGAVYAY